MSVNWGSPYNKTGYNSYLHYLPIAKVGVIIEVEDED